MLSHDEDRELRAIERWFEEADPKLTRMLRDHEAPTGGRQYRALRVTVYATGAFLLVFGSIVASAAGVVFGVLLLAAAGCMHIAARR
jgi:hypothetical protein